MDHITSLANHHLHELSGCLSLPQPISVGVNLKPDLESPIAIWFCDRRPGEIQG
jgi:hypothetical protein